MCFKKNKGEKLINLRVYKWLSGRYFLFFRVDKKHERILNFDLVNDGGIINLLIINKDNGETQSLEKMESGHYEFKLEKGDRYRLVITASKASGKYRISSQKID